MCEGDVFGMLIWMNKHLFQGCKFNPPRYQTCILSQTCDFTFQNKISLLQCYNFVKKILLLMNSFGYWAERDIAASSSVEVDVHFSNLLNALWPLMEMTPLMVESEAC